MKTGRDEFKLLVAIMRDARDLVSELSAEIDAIGGHRLRTTLAMFDARGHGQDCVCNACARWTERALSMGDVPAALRRVCSLVRTNGVAAANAADAWAQHPERGTWKILIDDASVRARHVPTGRWVDATKAEWAASLPEVTP